MNIPCFSPRGIREEVESGWRFLVLWFWLVFFLVLVWVFLLFWFGLFFKVRGHLMVT